MKPSTKRALKYGAWLQTTSIIALAAVLPAKAQTMASSEEVSEQVLVTGSLIHGAGAVGVPVQNFSSQDFMDSGSVTTADLFKDVPSVVTPQALVTTTSGLQITQNQAINIHNVSSTNAARTLLLIDGIRFPPAGDSYCQVDPSVIPTLAVDHIDLLADGASATYGSDAEGGVVNIILKRGFDGAITQLQAGASTDFGGLEYRASQLFGRTWDGGDITLSLEDAHDNHINASSIPSYTSNFFAANGLDNRNLLVDSLPATIAIGKPALASNTAGQNPTTATYTGTNIPGVPGSFAATQGTSCGNCYAVPSQNGVGLTWAAIVANTPTAANNTTLGTANEIGAFKYAWATPDINRTAATLTFDQTIVTDVQFFADAFYSNRRTTSFNATGSPAPTQNNAFQTAVPTTNPYYPTGAPAGILVDYDAAYESPIHIGTSEVGDHYDFGFNLTLPFKWLGKVYFGSTEDQGIVNETGALNPNNTSAALGFTIAASGTGGSFVKPAAVPYLNLFCDPTAFTCNSPATIAYISGFRDYHEQEVIGEYGLNFDGPVYTLPGGDIKAAVGGTYDTYAFEFEDKENYNNQSTSQLTDQIAVQDRAVWAAFGQLNIPIIGDANKLPFIEKLEVEGSVRYDHYSDVGSTTNPKVSATWGVTDGLEFKGAWGTAFRAPTGVEENGIAAGLIQPVNTAAGATSNTVGTCPSGATSAVAGSPAAILDGSCASSLQNLGGITLSNGATIASAVRSAGFSLQPETAQNISAGWEWAPTDPWFKGLDFEATYYFVRIRNKLQGCTNEGIDSPLSTQCYITPATYGEPFNGAINPTSDALFENAVQALLANPRNTVPLNTPASNIVYIFDGAERNIGWQSLNGVDFSGNYNWDMADIGAWNAGFTGNYSIDNKSQLVAGAPVVSLYSTPVNGTRDSGGRLRYRAHLGWNDPSDTWSTTAFLNFFPHSNSNGGALPPECFLQGQLACDASGMPQYAQYTQQYPTLSNYVPGVYTFDLQVAYKTHDAPANDYLKNIDVTLMCTDLFDRAPPFQYVTSGFPHASSSVIAVQQRVILLTVTKAW